MARLIACVNAGRHLETEKTALVLLSRDPNSGFVWKVLGLSLWAQGKNALEALERATKLAPGDAEAHNNFGNALLAAGQLERAMMSLRQALDLNPALGAAHSNLGNAWHQMGRLDDAIASYRRALACGPKSAIVHNKLGNALMALGRADEAVVSYRDALHIKHEYAEAHSNLGNALQALGQFAEAVASCREAIRIRPDFSEAHNNLGNALRGLKQPEEALSSYRRALEINPDFPEAHANAGDAWLDLCRLHEAEASYLRALALKPDYAEAHGKLGNALVHLWRFADAAESYRRALSIKPDYAEAHNGLGCALLGFGMGDAEGSFRRALKLKPDYAEAHNNLAYRLRASNRGVEAEESCRKALELEPDLTAAIALLAELHGDKGEFEEAERLYRRVMVIDPDSPLPPTGIPRLRTMSHADSFWLSEAQRIADKPLLPRQETALRYSLGKYFNDIGDFASAFASYRRANELAKSLRRKYDRLGQQQRTDDIIRLYDREWLDRARPNANPSPRPIFVVGLPRTGTTLVEQILASHPAVFGAGALNYWPLAAFEHASQLSSVDDRASLIGELASGCLQHLEKLSSQSLRVVDKMTSNFICLGLIHAALPNARIIHLRRNPIDTCLANYFDFSSVDSHANDLEDMAHYYAEYSRLMDHWRLVLPKDSMLEVSYEALVRDQETWSRRLVQFVGLPWDARCLEFHRTDRRVTTASKWQVRQKMHQGSVERWRNYADFIAPLLQALQLPSAPTRGV